MSTRSEPIPRPAGRMLVIDGQNRVLLFRARFEGREFWITPGGGLQDGETFFQAAARELWEETGFSCDDSSLPCVWTRSHVFEFRGRLIEQQERFFLLRLAEVPEITYEHWEADERNDLIEHRWWGAEEIEASTEVFAPRRIGALLRDLLEEGALTGPIDAGI